MDSIKRVSEIPFGSPVLPLPSFPEPYVVAQSAPYVFATTSLKPDFDGGVLKVGQVVRLLYAVDSLRSTGPVLGQVEELGIIYVDSRWLRRSLPAMQQTANSLPARRFS